ncbi:diguanylate cyclase [Salipiger sp.]|uniref:diguanylate cyclase n=1 Tax=Salipiger sp. TaxID=2078585 RepID=UPI003A97FEFC
MTGRILIADGVATNRIALRVKLKAAFYDVIQAETGTDALRLVRQQRPDLVIASADLPDMPGRDFCLRMRGQPDANDTPIILVHSGPDHAQRLRALAAGADDVISQPVDELVLLARLRSLLRARHAADELRLRDDTRRALGLSEPPAGFRSPARIALVSTRRGQTLDAAATVLRSRMSDRIETMSPEHALRAIDPVPEVFVIVDVGSTPTTVPGEGLAILTQLRASPNLRQSAIVYVTDPTHRREAASALDLGANDLLASGLDTEELLIRLPKQIDRKRTADRLRDNMRDGLRAAVTDPLTGLYNRRYVLPHLSRLAERAAQQGRPYALLLADLDHFKQINDIHGHAVGDAVLVSVANRFSENLRAADLVARIGGEEFLVAMPDADEEVALRTAERLRGTVGSGPLTTLHSGEPVGVTLSVGVAVCPPGYPELPDITLARADRALYAAKDGGRNRVSIAELGGSEHANPPSPAAAAGFGGY